MNGAILKVAFISFHIDCCRSVWMIWCLVGGYMLMVATGSTLWSIWGRGTIWCSRNRWV